MELFVQRIIVVRALPYAALVELEDGSYGICKQGISEASRWVLSDKNGDYVRFATIEYARKAFTIK